jgi:hypothetical protein
MVDNIDIANLKNYLHKHSFEVIDVQPILTRGVSSNVFKLVFVDNSVRYLKISHGHNPNFQVQQYISNLLREKGVYAPNISFVDMFSEFNNENLLIVDEIPGDSATAKQWKNELEVISMQLSTINSVEVQGFGKISVENGQLVGQYQNYKEYFLSESKFFIYFLGREVENFSKVFERIKTRYSELIDDSKEMRVGRLVHGDLPGHVYVLNSKYSGIIDFDDIHSSLPFYDIFESELFLPQSTFEELLEKWSMKINIENYGKYKILSEILFLIEESFYTYSTYQRLKRQSDIDAFTSMYKRLEVLSM